MVDPLFWKGKRVFVTGNTGFKGAWLSLWLAKMGSEVVGYALLPPTDPSLFELTKVAKCTNCVTGDVRDQERLISTIKAFRPEILIHMAAQPLVRESYIRPVETYSTNVMGTVHVLDAVRQVDSVRAVVNVTTDKCYENYEWPWAYRENEPLGGHDPYSNSKACSDLLTTAYRRSFFSKETYGVSHQVGLATARAGNVIGGGDFAKDRLIPDILRAIGSSEKVLVRSPNAIRPWQHVLEPLSGYLTLAQKLYQDGPAYSEAWNFGPRDVDAKPVEWIVKRLCDAIANSAGYELDSRPQPHEANYLKLDISKAEGRIGWKPRWNLGQALLRIVEWDHAYRFESGQSIRSLTEKQIDDYVSAAEVSNT